MPQLHLHIRQLQKESGAAAARYVHIKRSILERVAAGSWKPGSRVPSENELVRELGVARMTVNRALRELAKEGILVRVAGVGTFVAEPQVQAEPLQVRSIAEEIRARGRKHSSRVVLLESVPAPPEIAQRCEVRSGTRLDHSVVLHMEDGVPLQIEDRFVNPAVIPGYRRNDFARITPHEVLMRAAPLQNAEHTVRAITPDTRIRRLLKLTGREACLLVRRRVAAHGRIATVVDLYHPGSRYELSGTFRH